MTSIVDRQIVRAINNSLVQTVSKPKITHMVTPRQPRSHSGRRVIAACAYDYLFCFWIATAIMNASSHIFEIQNESAAFIRLLAFALFLFRDYFNGGRGFGKWLLRLRTVDAQSHRPPTLRQSLKRNFVLLAPYFLCEATVYLHNHSIVSFSIATIVIIAELIFMSRGAGLRVADRWARTIVVNEA